MRRITTVSALSALAATLAVVGCRNDSRPADGMTADLERDLQLAAAVRPERNGVVSAIEQAAGGPSGTSRGLRAPVHVRKRSPSESRKGVTQEVVATKVASDVSAPVFAVGVTQTAAPTNIPDPVVTSPSQGPSIGGPSAGAESGGWDEGTIGRGRGDDGRGRGPGGTGVIIRGGGAGDDHCEPNGGIRGRGTRGGGQIGGMGGIGGVIGGIVGGIGRIPSPRTNFPRY